MNWRPSIFGVIAFAVAVAAIYAIVEPVKVFGFDADAVAESLEGELPDPFGNAECREADPVWTCPVERVSGSGFNAAYQVEVDDEGCWRATPASYQGQPPPATDRLEACVDVWDITGISSLLDG